MDVLFAPSCRQSLFEQSKTGENGRKSGFVEKLPSCDHRNPVRINSSTICESNRSTHFFPSAFNPPLDDQSTASMKERGPAQRMRKSMGIFHLPIRNKHQFAGSRSVHIAFLTRIYHIYI
jgi:hypothetical protein